MPLTAQGPSNLGVAGSLSKDFGIMQDEKRRDCGHRHQEILNKALKITGYLLDPSV